MELFHEVGRQLVTSVLPVLGAAIATLLVGILTRYLRKVGLDLTEAQSNKLKTIVEDAVRAADEYSRRNPGMTSAAKSAYAKQIIVAKADDVNPRELDLALDAALPKVRAEDKAGKL